MMYYIIRIVVAIIIVLITRRIFNKHYNRCKQNNPSNLAKHKNNKCKLIVKFITFIIFIAVVFFPYESYFIRFNSPEKSVLYSVPSSIGSNIAVIEKKDTAFILLNRGNNYSYHSSIKYDNNYGFCDYQTKVDTLYQVQYVESNKFKGIFSLNTVYNKTTNTTCYLLNFIGDIYDNNITIYDDKNNKFLKLKAFENNTTYFYFVAEGSPESNINIIIDNEKFYFA